MSVSINGPWSLAETEDYLSSTAVPIRLACVAGDDFPRVVSIWYRYEHGKIYCASHRSSKLVALLQDNNRVGFEVAPNEPPYCGVRGQGLAELSLQGGGEVLEGLLQRYLGATDSALGKWLLSRSDDEVLITIEPLRLFSWDYRQRMRDTGTET